MSELQNIKNDIIEAMQAAGKERTSAYDTTAEVIRVENNVAWIHIPGGVEETPADLSVSAKQGDIVQVRVAGGRAWITGNNTAPPTDDRIARVAVVQSESAQNTAAAAYEAADIAHHYAESASVSASVAHRAANDALNELSTVQDVVGIVTWAATHSEQDMADFINSHLSLTPYGLNLTLDNTSYRIHIGTYTANGDDGVYVIDDEGHVVTFFGENIRFDSSRPQYIGGEDAYIVFYDSNNDGVPDSITIGGTKVNIGNNRPLMQVLDDIDNAREVATNYIKDTAKGMFIHAAGTPDSPTNTAAKGVLIQDNIDIIRKGKSVAKYGDVVRVGLENNSHLEIGSSSMTMLDRRGSKYFEINEQKDGNSDVIDVSVARELRPFVKYRYAEAFPGKVWVNDVLQTRNTDYTIVRSGGGDWVYAGIQFIRNLNLGDIIKVQYGISPNTHNLYEYTLGTRTGLTGLFSYVLGNNAEAFGAHSIAANNSTKATTDAQTAIGRYNAEDVTGKYGLILGNGTSDAQRSNAFGFRWDGDFDFPLGDTEPLTIAMEKLGWVGFPVVGEAIVGEIELLDTISFKYLLSTIVQIFAALPHFTLPTYTAPTVYNNMVEVVSGGYYQVHNVVYVQLSLQLKTAIAANSNVQIMTGFPTGMAPSLLPAQLDYRGGVTARIDMNGDLRIGTSSIAGNVDDRLHITGQYMTV